MDSREEGRRDRDRDQDIRREKHDEGRDRKERERERSHHRHHHHRSPDRHHHKERERDRQGHSSRHRSRSRSRSPSPRRSSRRSRSENSGSTSGSASESEESRRARKKKEKRRRRELDEESDYERRRRRKRRETSEERLERRNRKKEKKQSKRAKGGAILEYGKHGIISEADVTSRFTAEFRQWLVEERHINPETVSRATEKKEMMTFIEDFNTATMPSDKYYNLEAHERRMAMIRAGETVDQDDGYDPLADEAAAKANFKAQRRAAEESNRGGPTEWKSKEQLEALRRVQMERIEAAKMKQMGLQTSARLGVRMDGTEFDRR